MRTINFVWFFVQQTREREIIIEISLIINFMLELLRKSLKNDTHAHTLVVGRYRKSLYKKKQHIMCCVNLYLLKIY